MTFEEWKEANIKELPRNTAFLDLKSIWDAGYAEGKKESKKLQNCWNCEHWYCDDNGFDQCRAAHKNFDCNAEKAWKMKEGL